MNDDILNDIRQQVTEINKKSPRLHPWIIKLGLTLFLVFLIVIVVDVTHDAIRGWTEKPVDSWNAVEALVSRGDLALAYDMALRIERKAPADFKAAYHKGDILLHMRKLEMALVEYRKAYEVYPDKVIKDRIDAVTKSLGMEKVPNNASEAIAPQGGAQPQR